MRFDDGEIPGSSWLWIAASQNVSGLCDRGLASTLLTRNDRMGMP